MRLLSVYHFINKNGFRAYAKKKGKDLFQEYKQKFFGSIKCLRKQNKVSVTVRPTNYSIKVSKAIDTTSTSAILRSDQILSNALENMNILSYIYQ